jgi:hypothetical protein
MVISDIVKGLAAGVGIDLSPDGKIAYYVEWSIGEVSKVEVDNGKVEFVAGGFKYPEDVEVDWDTGDIFISERTGEITEISTDLVKKIVANPGGAPHQLALVKRGGNRNLYTVCFDSGKLIRIDVNSGSVTTLTTGLGHPIGLVLDTHVDFAYVTEQDNKSLTRIELSSGNKTVLYSGLTSPFYLAWDRNATGIFCVQRDPSNSLVKLDITATPVAAQIVATDLAVRPSGAAPNSDDSKIYICADQKLQVISHTVPQITPDPAPFEVHSIQFNYDESGAISLKDHVSDDYIHLQPEWIKNTRDEPAAYVRSTETKIRVVFRKIASSVSGNFAVGATGNLGGIRRKIVSLTFLPSGLSNPVDFELMWPLPGKIGKHRVNFEWYARRTLGAHVPMDIGSSSHTICTTWKAMDVSKDTTLNDWVFKMPMLWTSEWAAGKNNEKEICDAIINRLADSGMKYGVGGWDVRDMLNGYQGGPPGGMCGGWYKMFQHLAHCQGVFVYRRCYSNNPRPLGNNEVKWDAIVIKAGGLNQSVPTWYSRKFEDITSQYPIGPTTPITVVNEKRYIFHGSNDGHCINFLVYQGKLYLYDPSFGTGPFELAPFTGADAPLPPGNNTVVGGNELSSFKSKYLDTAVDYVEGSLIDGSGTLHSYDYITQTGGLTVRTSIIPDVTGSFKEITFSWDI